MGSVTVSNKKSQTTSLNNYNNLATAPVAKKTESVTTNNNCNGWIGGEGASAMTSAPNPKPKIVYGTAGYILEDVPHFTDYISDLPTYPNPLQDNPAYSVVKQYFVHVALTQCPERTAPKGDWIRRVRFHHQKS